VFAVVSGATTKIGYWKIQAYRPLYNYIQGYGQMSPNSNHFQGHRNTINIHSKLR